MRARHFGGVVDKLLPIHHAARDAPTGKHKPQVG